VESSEAERVLQGLRACLSGLQVMGTTMTKCFIDLAVCATATCALAGSACSHNGDFLTRYKSAVQSGFVQIPESLEIEELFGPADHFISSKNRNGLHDWNTEVFFEGRYRLLMQLEVEVDEPFSRVVRVAGEPEFHIWEVRKVDYYPSGQVGASFNGSKEVSFGRKEWDDLRNANGDLRAVGLSVDTSSVVGFDDYVKAVRKDRIEVRPD